MRSDSSPPPTVRNLNLGAFFVTATTSFLIACLWFLILSKRSIPVGDGGLGYVVTNTLLGNNFGLPTSIIFNGTSQPFSYPPLAAYLLAILHKILGIDVALLMTWLPLVWNLLAIAAYSIFVLHYFRERHLVLLAIMIFPATLLAAPMFFTGGAVSRSPGLVLLLLAWAATCRPSSPPHHTPQPIVGVVVGWLAAALQVRFLPILMLACGR